jgi:hypothetical protein
VGTLEKTLLSAFNRNRSLLAVPLPVAAAIMSALTYLAVKYKLPLDVIARSMLTLGIAMVAYPD